MHQIWHKSFIIYIIYNINFPLKSIMWCACACIWVLGLWYILRLISNLSIKTNETVQIKLNGQTYTGHNFASSCLKFINLISHNVYSSFYRYLLSLIYSCTREMKRLHCSCKWIRPDWFEYQHLKFYLGSNTDHWYWEELCSYLNHAKLRVTTQLPESCTKHSSKIESWNLYSSLRKAFLLYWLAYTGRLFDRK